MSFSNLAPCLLPHDTDGKLIQTGAKIAAPAITNAEQFFGALVSTILPALIEQPRALVQVAQSMCGNASRVSLVCRLSFCRVLRSKLRLQMANWRVECTVSPSTDCATDTVRHGSFVAECAKGNRRYIALLGNGGS